jgi:subtilisin family serine protease
MNFAYEGISDWSEILWDYLRHFHKNKAVNNNTGRRNPTVVNNSWGGSTTKAVAFVQSVTYRGTTTDISSMSVANKVSTLRSNGCPVVYISGTPYLYRIPTRSTAMDADIDDAIDDGVILVASAGNSRWNCESSGGQDYNNYIYLTAGPWGNRTIYHSRGSSPGSGGDMICVGSIGAKTQEYKSDFSNWGGRVDIWAPGSNIVSAVYNNSVTYEGAVADPRNNSYYIASISGTSMSGPQVTGLLACLCEQEPNLTQAEALQYLKEGALADVGDDSTTPEQSNNEGFGDSNNRYLFDMRKRPLDGMTHPAVLHKNRNTTTAGVKYPRVRNNRTTK